MLERFVVSISLALVSSLPRPAAAAPAAAPVLAVARIDHGYPPARDARRPDLTIAPVDAALVSYSPDGRTAVTAGGDRVARQWDARPGEKLTGAPVRSFEGQRGRIAALGWHGPGQLVAVSERARVERWEVATGKPGAGVTLKGAPRPVAVRPGAEPMLAGASGGKLGLWNHETGRPVKTFEARPETWRALAFTPDGKRLVAGSEAGTIQVLEVDGARARTFKAGAAVRSIAASATHVAAGLASGWVKVWSLDGEGEAPSHTLEPRGPVSVVAFSGKGDQLAAGGGRVVRVWDAPTGQLLCTQEGHTAPVLAVAFSPNGQKMASVAGDRTLRYWTVPLPPIPPADLEKITAALPEKAGAAPKKPRKVLVFWRADAILHKGGVPAANKAIELLGKKTGAFEAHFSRDVEALDPKVLATYDALVMNSTAHLILTDAAKKALLDYANGGGGIVGVHAAIDMFKSWPEGAGIVGATFGGHPWGPSGTWSVKLDEPGHPLLRAFGGKDFKLRDEFYELAAPYDRADRRVLMSLDLRDPATAGVKPLHRADRDFAVSWIKRQGQGRVFYCMFGHISEPFQNPAVLRYYLDGIQYALGDLDADATPRPAPPAAPPAKE